MAQGKNAPPPTEASTDAAPPKKKGKLLIILVALLVLGGGGGGAAWYFLGHGKAGGHDEAKKEEPEKPPIFTRLEQFTVNLQQGNGEDHYLQTEMDLQVADDKVIESIKLRMPQIRNALLLLLSSKSSEELASVEGKQKLAGDIVAQINKIIGVKEAKKEHDAKDGEAKPAEHAEAKEHKPPKEGVQAVYFNSFVIQ